jgi:DNA invertase Pin-like site-specific DNA recombinase
MEDLITLVNELNNRGVSFHSLEENKLNYVQTLQMLRINEITIVL